MLEAILLGIAAGFAINVMSQLQREITAGNTFQGALQCINWAEVIGAAVAGGTMGAILIFGTGLIATAILGAIGGAVSGQVGIYTEVAFTEIFARRTWNSQRIHQLARARGLGDPVTIVIDAGAGAISSVIGHGITRALFPTPTGLARPSYAMYFNTQGQPYLRSDANIVRTVGTASTIFVWKITRSIIEELLQVNSSLIFEFAKP